MGHDGRQASPAPSPPGSARSAESATLAVDAKAKALKAAGRPVIGFGAGEPDFPTPDYIVEAAVAACRDPRYHRYTPAGGLPELREAIAAKTLRDSGYEVDARRRSWSPTAASRPSTRRSPRCSTRATRCSCRRRTGRPTRSRSGWPAASRSRSPTDETTGYLATVEQLEAARTDRTKVLLFVSPSNPTGAVYSPRAGRGDRPLGGRARPLGGHRRDLRAPGLRRRAVRLDAGAGARAGRPLRRRQRRRQDLRHDRLAGGLADRARRRGQGRDQPAVARHLQRRQRQPGGRARRGPRRPVGGGEMREAFDRRRQTIVRMLREIPGVDVPGAARARSTSTRRSRALLGKEIRGRRPASSARARRADPRGGRGGGGAGRGVRHPGLRAAVLRARRRRPGRGRRPGCTSCSAEAH